MRPNYFVAFTAVALICLTACGSRSREDSVTLSPVQLSANYAPRIGVAVRTATRTCLAIHNANLAASSPLTIVLPFPPQSFTLARIESASQEACPITKELDSAAANYELTLPGGDDLPKNTPFIAVVGDPTHFLKSNITVQADMEADGSARQFRACGTTDGVHLTVWAATPLRSPRLWHAFYDDPTNPAGRPPCTPADTAL